MAVNAGSDAGQHVKRIAALRLRGATVVCGAAFAGLTCGAPLSAQGGGQEPISVPVVQPLPPKASGDLAAALRKLGSNPNDSAALLAAGWASVELSDLDAAAGFFSRAATLPGGAGNARVGLAAVQVYRKNPVEALKLFADAEALGADLAPHAAERGLAYDLVGDNASAQEFYRLALQRGENEEISRRLALSQAIGGDLVASEATLLPLLQHRDLAAYRSRAFALAAQGRTEEAVAIADAVMPPALASRIAPYLRYMPKLTRAQQAAAGNFGHFPEADSIGKDDPRIAEYAAAAKLLPQRTAALDTRLVPAGEPLGAASAKPAAPQGTTIAVASTPAVAKPAASQPTPTPTPARTPTPPPVRATAPATVERPAPALAAAATPASTASVSAQPTQPPPASSTVAAIDPGFSLASLAGGNDTPSATTTPALAQPTPTSPASTPPASPATTEPPPSAMSLADAFAEFASLPAKVEPAPGAVDITRIAIPREPDKKAEEEKARAEAAKKAEAEKKKADAEKKAEAKKKAASPSRVWVQVGTGQSLSALAFDWRKFQREQAKLFGGRKGYSAKWGRTNRLVTGPFANAREANAFIKQLKAAGIDCFIFTSDAGEEVSPL